jgi:hypothetical protein
VVEDEKPGWRVVRKSFPELLDDPGASRETRDVEVENVCGPQKFHPCSQNDEKPEFISFGFFPT